MAEHEQDIDELVSEFKKYVEQLSLTLIRDIPKEVHKANNHYLDIVNLVGELHERLAKPQ